MRSDRPPGAHRALARVPRRRGEGAGQTIVGGDRGPEGFWRSGAGAPDLASRVVGHAVLVYPAGQVDAQAVAFAAGLAIDPEHQVVVVDLPAGSDLSDWESVADLLGTVDSIRLI